MPFTSQEILIGGTAVAVLLVLIILLPTKHKSANPYERLTSVLTPSEQYFYKVLSSSIGDRAIVMAKIRVADLIKVRRGIKEKHFWSYFSKISQKHIDFVLLDPVSFKTLCLVELDDKSHYRISRSKRDQFINQAMAQAEIPLFRFPVKRRYDRSDLLQRLKPCLNIPL